VRITREDVWYQWDEIHGSGIHIDDLIAEIRIKMGDRRLTAIVADSARPDLIEYMQAKGLPVIPAPKHQNSVAAGIQLFSKRLRPRSQLIGDPRPNYYVDTVACPMTHHDFTHYRYKEVKVDRHPMENPEKRFDDMMDALRYGELFFKFGQIKDDKIPQNSTLKETNSFGLI
jgi:phage terminase large subunit